MTRMPSFIAGTLLLIASAESTVLRADGPHFVDVTKQVGLENLSGGVAAWVDYDQDGWVDLYVSGQLWRNVGGDSFEQVVDGPNGGPGIWGDFDNDGYPDLFCWSGTGRLFRNKQGQGFEDVSNRMPKLPTTVSLGATWGDWNKDGYLDLYIGGYEVWPSQEFPDVIYLNQAGKQFVEAWRQKRIRRARGVTAADFDEDGDLDIYVSNYRLQPNILWQNDGQGRFTDVAAKLGAAGDGALGAWGHTIGSAWGDLDNDGHLDLFVGNFSHPPDYQDRPKFLRNLGPQANWRFEDKSGTAGLRWQESYASPALADFDNDGWLDLFFTTVYPGDKSVLYRNRGNWKFEDVSAASHVDVPQTYQAAWADFDHDGDVDLVTGGRLFQNPGGPNHWLEVRLKPDNTLNGTGIGSVVRVTCKGRTITRQVEGATGQGNQSDMTLHFGLGEMADPVALTIRWPDGTTQTATTPTNRIVVIKYQPKP